MYLSNFISISQFRNLMIFKEIFHESIRQMQKSEKEFYAVPIFLFVLCAFVYIYIYFAHYNLRHKPIDLIFLLRNRTTYINYSIQIMERAASLQHQSDICQAGGYIKFIGTACTHKPLITSS